MIFVSSAPHLRKGHFNSFDMLVLHRLGGPDTLMVYVDNPARVHEKIRALPNTSSFEVYAIVHGGELVIRGTGNNSRTDIPNTVFVQYCAHGTGR